MPKLVTIGCLVLINALAQANEWRPADFEHAEDKHRMDKLIEWPEFSGDISLILNCFTQVQSNGKMEQTNCFLQNNHDQTFVAKVVRAAKKARLNPAIIDGKPATVYLQFRVEFFREGDQQQVYFYLNPGYEENVKAYGYDHVAGQREIGRNEPWSAACPQRARYMLWVRAYLGEDGVADSPTLQHTDGIIPTGGCQNAIKQTILQSRYTPATADGEPVPSTFIEFFGN